MQGARDGRVFKMRGAAITLGESCFLVMPKASQVSLLLVVLRVGGEAECADYRVRVQLGGGNNGRGGGRKLMFEGRPVSTEVPMEQWEEVRPVLAWPSF